MPSKVITTLHQLAAACKIYKGIVYTDKDGNIIDDMNDITDEENVPNTPRTTGVHENDTLEPLQEWTLQEWTMSNMKMWTMSNMKITKM